MIENQDIAVQLNFELIKRIYDNHIGETLAITGELNIEPLHNAESFSKTLKVAFENNPSIKYLKLSNASVETINALLPALRDGRTNIKLILVDDLSEVLLSSICLSLYNNPNRPEIRLMSPTNISPLCKSIIHQHNKNEEGCMEFESINGLQNSGIQSSLKRPFEPNLQAQDSMKKKICLAHNNNMENAMDVETPQLGHANQLLTSTINNFHQPNQQYPYGSHINNFQNIPNPLNLAHPMHMQQQRTDQQQINGYQPYGNYYSNPHYPQSLMDSRNTQQTMTSFPTQNYLNNLNAYNPIISQNLQSPHLDLTEQPKAIETLFALYDYEAEQTGHLAFKKGDIITILEKNDDGLWLGELDGKKGMVPGMVPSHFFKQRDEKSIIFEFLEKNSTNGIERLARLIIDHKNIPIADPDENLQKIKYLLDDESYNPIIREAILEEISHRTKVDFQFQDNYTVAQILLWFDKDYHYDFPRLFMGDANLGNLSPDQWTAFFAGLKSSGFTLLEWVSNRLGELSSDQWTAFLAGLKGSGITSLSFSDNDLVELSPDQWAKFFAGLKGSGITSLSFSYNYLVELSADQFTEIYAGLKGSGITSLSLNYTNLNDISPAQWTIFFAGLKGSDITSLNFSGNELGSLSFDQWTAFCAGLKDSDVTSLKLYENELIDLSPAQWTAFWAALKGSGITSLDLGNNALHKLSPDKWAVFFAGLKGSGITSLDFYNHDPYYSDDNYNYNMQQVTEIIQENLDYSKEIEKNAIVLGYLQYNTESRFSKLPVEKLFDIASGMGKNENVIEKDEKAEKIVKKNFPSIDSDNEQDASKKAEEEFQKYSANFKFQKLFA